MNESGLHIIANFFGCKNASLLVDKEKLSKLLVKSVEKNSLTILDKSFYKFDEGGITGFLLLSESHISIHTWPERDNYLSLDIFVCNFNKDNTGDARNIYKELLNSFKPSKVVEKFMERD